MEGSGGRFPSGPQYMKRFVYSSVLIYIAVAILLLVIPDNFFPDFYQPIIMASLALSSAFLIMLPRFLFREKSDKKRMYATLRLQGLIALILLLNGLGGLGLYKLYVIGFEYDKLMHFTGPMLLTLFGSDFVSTWFDKKRKNALIVSGGLVVLGGLLWESLEAMSDAFLGTSLLGGGEGLAALDTMIDLIMNVLGVLLAFAVFRIQGTYQRRSEG